MLGGEVWSFRPVKLERGRGWGVAWVVRGGENPRTEILEHPHPNFADRQSALWYRSWLIATEVCDRLVSFYRPGRSRGTDATEEWAYTTGRPTYPHEKRIPA